MKYISGFQEIEEISSLSNRELGESIVASISKNIGIDLSVYITKTGIEDESFLEFRRKLVEGLVFKFHEESKDLAEDELGPRIDQELLEQKLNSSDIESEPNWLFNPADLKIIQEYKGDEISTYIRTLSKRFEQMTEDASASKIATQLISSGLLSLSVAAGIQVIKGKIIGFTLKRAVIAGVKSMGVGSIVVTVGIMLVKFLWWLLADNPKNMFGLIINKSEDDLIVENYGDDTQKIWMNAGTMNLFMQDQETLASEKIQIQAGYIDEEDISDSCYYGGIYFADKKFGGYGAEGIFYLKTKKRKTNVAVMFACPYHADNGVAMSVVDENRSLKDEFNKLYKDRKVNFYSEETHGIKLQSRVNSYKGGCASNIGIIELPSSN